jgi:hypothetical protein
MVTRLSGGLTPADGGDPRTFPAIWNTTAGEIETAQSNITSAQSDITSAQSDITSLQSDVTTAQSDITTLDSSVTSAESDITTLQSDMTTAQSDITTLQGQVGATPLFQCGILSGINVNTTQDPCALFDTGAEILNVGTFTYTTSAITVPTTGVYMVAWDVFFSGNVGRGNPGFQLLVNGSVDNKIRTAHSYVRNSDGHEESTSNASGLVSLTANDTLGIRTSALALTGTINTDGTGSFSVYRVGSAS